MNKIEPPGLFITGTNTEVGKTYLTALIAKALVASGKRVGVYKPVASGCAVEPDETRMTDDPEILWHAAGRPSDLHAVCPQRFAAPLAPHLAARAVGKVVDEQLLRAGIEHWRRTSDIVLVEGVGGLMSPISDNDYVADLAIEFGYPLIVVAPNTLGVINQTLQTLIVAATFRDGLDVAGIVVNQRHASDAAGDPSVTSNYEELVSRCIPPVLGSIGYDSETFSPAIDWMSKAECGGSKAEA